MSDYGALFVPFGSVDLSNWNYHRKGKTHWNKVQSGVPRLNSLSSSSMLTERPHAEIASSKIKKIPTEDDNFANRENNAQAVRMPFRCPRLGYRCAGS